MTVSSITGYGPVNEGERQQEKQKEEEKQPVSIYHKLDTESADGKKSGDGVITVKEFGIVKTLNKIEDKLNDLKSKATSVTYNVLNALFKMVNALRTSFKYDISEEGLKSVDTEAISRQQDTENIESIVTKLKKDEQEAVNQYKKTQFGLLEKPENEDIDAGHNAKAKELTAKEENEKINQKHQKDLDRIFKDLVKQRKSVAKLEPKEVPLEHGNYKITKIQEEPIFVGGKTKGESRTETGSHVHIPDIMQLTIEYEFKGVDGKTEKSVYIAETTDVPKDYADKKIDDEKPIESTQTQGDLSKMRW